MYAMQDTPDFIINFYTLLHNFAYLDLLIYVHVLLLFPPCS